MSNIKQCDRCGAAYTPSERSRIIIEFDAKGVKQLSNSGDTCPECATAFKVWWNRWKDSMASSPKRREQ